MGNRANIQIKYSEGADIFFYSHWDGSNVNGIVQAALIRGKNRWNDDSYLARIIFSEMIKDNLLEETGYGISPYEIESGSPKCIVDTVNQVVTDTHGVSLSFGEYSRKVPQILKI